MKRYRKAVSALVLRKGDPAHPVDAYQFLLVHKPRKRDAWQLPQGGIEEGETIIEAARREVKEEAGLDLAEHLHESACVYTYDFPKEFLRRYRPVNAGQTLAFAAFMADREAQVTVDDREVDAYVWITMDALRTYIKRAPYADVIEQVYRESLSRLSSSGA